MIVFLNSRFLAQVEFAINMVFMSICLKKIATFLTSFLPSLPVFLPCFCLPNNLVEFQTGCHARLYAYNPIPLYVTKYAVLSCCSNPIVLLSKTFFAMQISHFDYE